MKLKAKQLYHDMLNDLQHCQNKGLPPAVETECCYRISEKYWDILRNELRLYDFTSIEEEIYFFKEIKPRFVAESEYYRLLNYSDSFCPEDAYPNDQKNFWIRQMNRLDKFKTTYQEFYLYYLTRDTARDREFFSRGDIENDSYEFDRVGSNYDHLVAQLLARERFSVYSTEKLKLCMENL